MEKVYCMWCLKNQPSKFSKVTGKTLCAVCDNSAVVACRPTKRAPDVKPRRAVKAKTRKASRG